MELEARTKRIQGRTTRLSRFATAASEEERSLGERDRVLGVEITASENAAVEVLRAGAKLNNRLSEISTGQRMAAQQKERLGAKLTQLAESADALAAERLAIAERHGALAAEAAERGIEIEGLKQRRRASEDARLSLDAETGAASQRLAAERSRRELLEDLQRRREGVSEAARSILEMNLPGARGLVAELLDVPAELAAAVEGLLGEDASAVVMDTTETAVAAVRALAERQAGRAKVMSLERAAARGRAMVAGPVEGLQPAGEWVSAAEGCGALVSALFGDALVAKTLDEAVSANGRTAGMRIVTYAGEVVGPDGGISGGGSAGKAGGLIWRKAEIERLTGVEEEIRGEIAVLGARRAEMTQEIGHLAQREHESQRALSEMAARMAEAAGAIAAADRRSAEMSREIAVVKSEIAGMEKELSGADAERDGGTGQDGRIAAGRDAARRANRGLEARARGDHRAARARALARDAGQGNARVGAREAGVARETARGGARGARGARGGPRRRHGRTSRPRGKRRRASGGRSRPRSRGSRSLSARPTRRAWCWRPGSGRRGLFASKRRSWPLP